ncbi:hypothetical protein TRV_03785 [Trichophyton verrucosum HKI 0517]|uniref:F-box domain-containing protein n=1 Tax=Trichophyton verrucosum (strain HKI 0517) TaxID=663202 RepID=D4D9J2_TRIVH|nr:uncharacterized protein TRV_03785 [Trichophyton verrucosum HKI 0517]EFE41480.1 hypothetical protein TRV_03785 [Trichophyton verrucosum HKI 0517]
MFSPTIIFSSKEYIGIANIEHPEVSGVSRNNAPHFIYRAPPNFDDRWDDPEDDLEDASLDPEDEVVFNMHIRVPMRCRSGFIIHASCYSLLEQFFSPGEVPIARLMDLFWSCPILGCGMSTLDWGHEYGGACRVKEHYPWEQRVVKVEGSRIFYKPDISEPFFLRDPWEALKDDKRVKALVRRARLNDKRKKRRMVERSTAPISGYAEPNCLTSLTLELLELIIVQLPTVDALALSQASKGLARIIPSNLGQSFWRSRFQPDLELGYAFEANKTNCLLDWKWLYFKFRDLTRFEPGLKNRKRIWKLIRSPISELAALGWSGDTSLRPLNIEKNQLRWTEGRGVIHPMESECPDYPDMKSRDFQDGCKEFYTQLTAIPDDIHQIIATTVVAGEAPFVSGLRFITKGGPDICLGYTRGGERQYLDIVGGSAKSTGLKGFALSVGQKGIHGLRAISQDGRCSESAGLTHKLLEPQYLVVPKRIISLEAGFDGFKMVRLAIAEYQPNSSQGNQPPRKKRKTELVST